MNTFDFKSLSKVWLVLLVWISLLVFSCTAGEPLGETTPDKTASTPPKPTALPMPSKSPASLLPLPQNTVPAIPTTESPNPIPSSTPKPILTPGPTPSPTPTPVPPNPSRPANLSEGLIAHYAFEGNLNSHDRLHDGVNYYINFHPSGITGQAAKLSTGNTDSHAYVFDKPGFEFSKYFSFSVWIAPYEYHREIGLPILASRGLDFLAYAFYWTPGGAEVILNQGTSYEFWPQRIKPFREEVQALGAWQHWVATYDGKSVKIYFNGKLDFEAPYSRQISQTQDSTDIFIGRCDVLSNKLEGKVGTSFYSDGFSGSMDELRLYNRALDHEEVEQLYQFK